MDEVDRRIADAIEALQSHGAVFAYLHGSRAAGTAGPNSDIDVAAYFDGQPPAAFEVLLPAGVDLVVLNRAHREFAEAVLRRGG